MPQNWFGWRQKRTQKSASDEKYLIALVLRDPLEDF